MRIRNNKLYFERAYKGQKENDDSTWYWQQKQKSKQRKKLANFYVSENKAKATKAEWIFFTFLCSQKIKFRFQKLFMGGRKFYIADFYLPKEKVIIEIDGDSHIGKEEYDKERDNFFINVKRIGIIHFKNEQIFSGEAMRVFIKEFPKNATHQTKRHS